MLKDKTIVFCLPGKQYSGDFLGSFVEIVMYCQRQGATTYISQKYSSMVNFARCLAAGADVRSGEYQTPFGGKIDYDYLLWIDSDQVFNYSYLEKLLEVDQDIVSGWYCQPGLHEDGSRFTPVVETMDDNFFLENGYYKFMSSKEISKKTEPFKVDYIGFGWVLIKKGVFEQIKYPWFAPKRIKVGDWYEMCSEDVSFCIDAKELGIDIWVDPKCRVGHEKVITV